MIAGLFVILAVAVVDWIAVARGWRKVELVAKPATMLALFVFLLLGMIVNGSAPVALFFFAAGLLFSMLGDIFLMLSDRWFVPGVAAFLLAHVAYIVGFNLPLPEVSSVWMLGIALILALTARRVVKRIVIGMRAQGKNSLVAPIVIYSIVITAMLLSALLTFFRAEWGILPATLAVIGAILFYFSDVILAWNKFVNPIKHGRLVNMIAYHLGQILLIGGVLLQFLF